MAGSTDPEYTALERAHKLLLALLYTSTVVISLAVLYRGRGYYFSSLADRPRLEYHDILKPGGLWGHGLGIIGMVLMVLLLGYIIRKHVRSLQRVGNIRHWLDVHIWMGITGPVLVTLHTAFKFGGIVSVAFWSMMAVMISGIFGRYIYLQIPRTVNGQELSRKDILEQMDIFSRRTMTLDPERKKIIDKILEVKSLENGGKSVFVRLFSWIMHDFEIRSSLKRLRRELSHDSEINRADQKELLNTLRKQAILKRRLEFLETAKHYLHYWHVVHRPFAIVMYVIAAVHILITLLFGYTWVF